MQQTIRTSDGKVYTGEVVEGLRVEGREYWFVNSLGKSMTDVEDYHTKCTYRYNTLNHFKTIKEAEAKRTHDLAVGEVTRRIEELGEGEYYLIYSHGLFTKNTSHSGEIYDNILPLMSESTAETIIKEYKYTLLPIIFKIK